MRTNPLKTTLHTGQPSYGAWLSIPSLETARAMSRQGFDWLTVDCEHTAFTPNLMAQMVGVIADSNGPVPLVRLPSKRTEEWFKWALDAGAWGVIVPYVNTAEEAAQAVEWCKYPPVGKRSYGAYFASSSFGTNASEYFKAANDQIVVIVQIETAQAVNNLKSIASVPGLDALFVGPNDLHLSLGLPPSNEGSEPEFVAALEQIKNAAKQHSLGLGMYTSGGEAAAKRVLEGFNMVSVVADLSVLVHGAQQQLHAAKNAGVKHG